MRTRPGSWIGSGIGVALGMSGMLGVAGVAAGSVPELVAAALLGAGACFLLVAGGWIDPLLLVVASLPLPAPYETDTARLAPVLVASAVAVGGWALRRGMDRDRLVPSLADARPVLLLLGALCVAGVFADRVVDAARELVNFTLLLGLFLLTLDRVGTRPERAATLARWIAAAAALAGAFAVPEALGLLPSRFHLGGTRFNRAAGGFDWPNELAMLLSISFPFCVYAVRAARTRVGRAWAGAGVTLAALGLVATFSRGSWLSLAVAPAVLLLIGERATALRFWAVFLLGAVVLDLAWGGAIVSRITATSGDVLVAQRILLTLSGLLMFQAHPLLGVGPGGFGAALDQVGLQLPSLFDFVDSAQNGYVQMAAEAGIVGLAALLLFVGYTLARMVSSARKVVFGGYAADELPLRSALLWSFGTACVVSLFEWPFAHGVGELVMVVAAAGIALARVEPAAR